MNDKVLFRDCSWDDNTSLEITDNHNVGGPAELLFDIQDPEFVIQGIQQSAMVCLNLEQAKQAVEYINSWIKKHEGEQDAV